MANKYAKHVSARTTDQHTRAKSSQKKNNAGGYSFVISDWDRLNRFLILGSEGGTYYVKENKLTKDNAKNIIKLIKEDGARVVNETVTISHENRAPKNDPAIFVMALAIANGSPEVKRYALDNITKVCRIPTHVFMLAEMLGELGVGWGRGVRRAFGSVYTDADPDKLAYHMVKYRNREGWTHIDLFRKAHPVPESTAQKALFRWAVAGMDGFGKRSVKRVDGSGHSSNKTYSVTKRSLPRIVGVYEEAQTASEKKLVDLIVEHNLPREAIPTEHLNSVKVWEALLHRMPMTAMIRNLGKMASIGLVKPLSEASKKVVQALKGDQLTKSRVHPLQILVALKTYSQGRGLRGSLSWTPVPAVVSALDKAFYDAFGNVEPVGGPMLYALDVSGSMGWCHCAGTDVLIPAEGAAAMALVLASTEDNYHIKGFADSFRDLGIHKGMSLEQALNATRTHTFGGTDCSLPAVWALQNKVELDGIVVITDSETCAGRVHPFQALKNYRNAMSRPTRQVVMGMTSTNFTIADPTDALSMDIAGFDAGVPNLISQFVRG